jgi:hypothetical protein
MTSFKRLTLCDRISLTSMILRSDWRIWAISLPVLWRRGSEASCSAIVDGRATIVVRCVRTEEKATLRFSPRTPSPVGGG